MHAARHYGVPGRPRPRSAEQHELRHRAGAQPPGSATGSRCCHDDYRDLTGTYDKLVSIEMIEAVDWREHDTFFGTASGCCSRDGLMALQAIVDPRHRYERAKNTEDFIKAFIFPGGCLPSIEAITRSSGRATDLTLTERRRVRAALRRDAAPMAGQPRRPRRRARTPSASTTRFRRMWDFYLAYCEAAFDEREISVVQCVPASRPGARVTAPR